MVFCKQENDELANSTAVNTGLDGAIKNLIQTYKINWPWAGSAKTIVEIVKSNSSERIAFE